MNNQVQRVELDGSASFVFPYDCFFIGSAHQLVTEDSAPPGSWIAGAIILRDDEVDLCVASTGIINLLPDYYKCS